MHIASKEEGHPQSDGKVISICCSVQIMQKIFLSALGVHGEAKGHVAVMWVNVGMVQGAVCAGNVSGP